MKFRNNTNLGTKLLYNQKYFETRKAANNISAINKI